MRSGRNSLLLVLALSACASSDPPAREPTSGSEVVAPEETDGEATSGSTDAQTSSTDAPLAPEEAPSDDLTVFSDPVRARLEALPSLPVPASTPVLTLTLFDASLICGFLDQNVRQERTARATCPDGSPVVLGGECNPASVLALRHQFEEACSLRFGDYLACEIAARASPCAVGFMRADLPECEAVNACLQAQQLPD